MSDFNRYFAVRQGSFIHTALNNMEEAGTETLKQLDAFTAEGQSLIGGTLQGTLKTLMIVSKNNLQMLPVVADNIEILLQRARPEIFKRKNAVAVIPLVHDVTKGADLILKSIGQIAATVIKLESDVRNLGLDPNFWVNFGELNGAPKLRDPSKAVLTINGYTVYPEAYKVFADWVIKMPPYISQHGNSFIPPSECEAIGQERLAEMTMGIALEEYRHNHASARQRVLGLKKIELKKHRV